MYRLALLACLLLVSGCELVDLVADPPASGSASGGEPWVEMLVAVNDARSEGRTCGDEAVGPAPSLAWDGALQGAAQRHSQDMEANDRFSHVGSDGTRVGDRARDAGYEWRRVGENLARMDQPVGNVVQALLRSPSHCLAIMDARFTEMGAAELDGYWTQVFAQPR